MIIMIVQKCAFRNASGDDGVVRVDSDENTGGVTGGSRWSCWFSEKIIIWLSCFDFRRKSNSDSKGTTIPGHCQG